MKRKKTLIIFAALAVALVGVILAEVLINRHVDSINSVDEIILTESEEALTSIEITSEEGSIKLVKSEETWQLDGDADFPIDADKMTEFIENFTEVHASFAIDDVQDFGQYGLEDPVCTMTFTSGETQNVYTMGDFSTIDEKRYVSVNKDKVYLVDEDPYEVASVNKDDYMLVDAVPMLSLVKTFTMSGDQNMDIIYDDETAHVYTNMYNYYLKDGDTYRELDSEKIKTFMNKLTAAELTEYVTYTASKDDLSQYGLATPTITIDVAGLDLNENEYSYTVYLGGVVSGEETFDDGTSENTYDAYIRVGDSEKIYKFSGEDYADFIYTIYTDLRPEEVIALNWDEFTSLDVTLDGTAYTITSGKETIDPDTSNPAAYDEDELDTVYYIGEDLIDFADAKNELDTMLMAEYSDEAATGKEELSFTIHQEDDICKEITIVIYQYDSTYCSISVNGQMLGRILRSAMADLKEGLTSAVLSRGESQTETTEAAD